MNPITTSSDIEFCWQVVGIAGDRSCPELSNFIHCQNCPVYSAAGRQLLERSLPNNYQQEWMQSLEQKSIISEGTSYIADALASPTVVTVVIFRLQQEWLALSAQVFQETTPLSKIHTIPHRSNQILRGLVNIRGELYLCISLSNLLNLEAVNKQPLVLSSIVYPRMVVVEKFGNTWVFAVDEIYGLHRFHLDELKDPPSSRPSTYTQGLFFWQSCSISYLDDELLFAALERKVLL